MTDIGYAYQAAIYCPKCVLISYRQHNSGPAWRLIELRETNGHEATLDALAELRGIDRQGEFDSGDFPAPYVGMPHGGCSEDECQDLCDMCGTPLNDECPKSGLIDYEALAREIDALDMDTVFSVIDGKVMRMDGAYAPEVWHNPATDVDVDAPWDCLTGLTGQYSYNGAVMHPSEYVGSEIARGIVAASRNADGWCVFAIVPVEVLPEDDEDPNPNGEGPPPAGWAIAWRELAATWTEREPAGPQDGGDVGGDVQIGTAWCRSWTTPTPGQAGYWSTLTSYYYVCETTLGDGATERFIESQIEYLVCTDPTDPGSTEVWTNTEFDHLSDMRPPTDELARQFSANESIEDFNWDGSPKNNDRIVVLAATQE